MSTQFVKNTNSPDSSSELWTVAEGWKISAKSGKIYTNLDKVFKNEVNPESEDNDFYNALIDQLDGKVTEPIDFCGYYFVAGASQDGTELVYAFEKSNLDGANKQVKYSHQQGGSNSGSVPKTQPSKPQQQQQTFKSQPQASNTSASSTVNTQKPQVVQKTIDVVTDVTPIKVGDISAIGEAEQRGLYVLPIIHVGNNRFCFENSEGDYILLYGRIISVKVADN
jgi:hypothetical protein